MHAPLAEALLWGSTLTARKLWNAARVSASYYVAKAVGKPVHWGLPMSVGIEPTTACNLRCPHCPSGLRQFERPTGRLDVERYKAIIDELHPHLLYLILYFQGEPYIHTQFLELVEYATRHNVFTMTSTNAHFLTPETARRTVEAGLGRVVVSVDGATQKTYAQYRVGGQLEKVLEGIRNLVAAKRELKRRRPFIDLQCIAFQHNEHELEQMKVLGKSLGVNRVRIKTAQIYDFGQAHQWLPDDPRLRRYERDAQGNFRLKTNQLKHCWKLWHAAEVTWDGQVLPCCFDKDARFAMGRVPETPFAQVWRSTAYRQFRQQVLRGRQHIELCTNCTEGTRVWS